MTERPPTTAKVGIPLESSPPHGTVSVEVSPGSTAESVALTADTTAESVALTAETTVESVALTADNTVESVALTADNTVESVALSTDTTVESVAISVEDATASREPNVSHRLASFSTVRIVEMASEGASDQLDPPSYINTGLVVEPSDSISRVMAPTSESSAELVHLTNSSMMYLDDSPDSSEDSLGILPNSTNNSATQTTANEANTASPSTTSVGTISNSTTGTRTNDSRGPGPNSSNDAADRSNEGGNGSRGPRTDHGNGTMEHGDATPTPASQLVPANRPPSVLARLLPPRWVALFLGVWNATATRTGVVLRSVRRILLYQWRLWTRVLIPLIGGRGTVCYPRNLMLELASKRYAALTRDVSRVVDVGGTGDTLALVRDEVSMHVSIQMTEQPDRVDFQSIEMITSAAEESASFEFSSDLLLSPNGSDSSWESWQGSSGESFTEKSFESDFDSDDECDIAAVAVPSNSPENSEIANPKPTIEAPPDDLHGVDDKDVCLVCYSRRITRKAFVPCGHAQLCRVCVSAYPPKSNCPMCRREIESIINIY